MPQADNICSLIVDVADEMNISVVSRVSVCGCGTFVGADAWLSRSALMTIPGELISPGNCPQHIFSHSNRVSSSGRLDVSCLKRHVSTRYVFRVSECRTEAVNSTIIEGFAVITSDCEQLITQAFGDGVIDVVGQRLESLHCDAKTRMEASKS